MRRGNRVLVELAAPVIGEQTVARDESPPGFDRGGDECRDAPRRSGPGACRVAGRRAHRPAASRGGDGRGPGRPPPRGLRRRRDDFDHPQPRRGGQGRPGGGRRCRWHAGGRHPAADPGWRLHHHPRRGRRRPAPRPRHRPALPRRRRRPRHPGHDRQRRARRHGHCPPARPGRHRARPTRRQRADADRRTTRPHRLRRNRSRDLRRRGPPRSSRDWSGSPTIRSGPTRPVAPWRP